MKKSVKRRAAYAEELAAEVEADFESRREARKPLERQWELNLNFLAGRQYTDISARGELVEDGKAFFWQSRGVFNHIAPIMELRLAKLGKIDPVPSVRPRGGGDEEVSGAKRSEKLLRALADRLEFKKRMSEAAAWSETCGTAFYKVEWDGAAKEARIRVVPPFGIYPDHLGANGLEEVKSLICARVADADEIFALYGKRVKGGTVETIGSGGKCEAKNAVTVIERYERESAEFPRGRLLIAAAGQLLYAGELPYINGEDGARDFPFVRQASMETAGSFFGQSVIERLIPVQRAYNAVKNRKHEFINRHSMGVMNVEDGSLDTDELAEDGLSPGKILVYRQGAKPPEMLKMSAIPADFKEEEQNLLNEFTVISGVSDVASSSMNATVSSGTALEILIEQDNERMTVVAERIRAAYKKVAVQLMRLYRQFTAGAKAIVSDTEKGKVSVEYVAGAEINDDVVIENENELLYGEARKKEMLLDMYKSGIFTDGEGKLNAEIKEKILSLLGYGELAGDDGLRSLHAAKAKNENGKLVKKELSADGYDDHGVHIEEHVRYVLGEDGSLDAKARAYFAKHIAEHKKYLSAEEER